MPNINQAQTNLSQEEKKVTSSNFFEAMKTEAKDFERTIMINKKLDTLHKDIDILQIFDSFKNIVNLSSINELKSQFNEHSKISKNDKKDNTLHSNCINDISILYSTLPKISNYDSYQKKPIENSELSSFNWSPIDLPDQRQQVKSKNRSPRRFKGFSINNRKINFSKSDSIFITNATAEKTYTTNQNQKSVAAEKEEISKKYNKERNNSTNNYFDQTNNQSSYFGMDTLDMKNSVL